MNRVNATDTSRKAAAVMGVVVGWEPETPRPHPPHPMAGVGAGVRGQAAPPLVR